MKNALPLALLLLIALAPAGSGQDDPDYDNTWRSIVPGVTTIDEVLELRRREPLFDPGVNRMESIRLPNVLIGHFYFDEDQEKPDYLRIYFDENRVVQLVVGSVPGTVFEVAYLHVGFPNVVVEWPDVVFSISRQEEVDISTRVQAWTTRGIWFSSSRNSIHWRAFRAVFRKMSREEFLETIFKVTADNLVNGIQPGITIERLVRQALGEPDGQEDDVSLLGMSDLHCQLFFRPAEGRRLSVWFEGPTSLDSKTVRLIVESYLPGRDPGEAADRRLDAVFEATGEPPLVLPSPFGEAWQLFVYPALGLWYEGSREEGTYVSRGYFPLRMTEETFKSEIYRDTVTDPVVGERTDAWGEIWPGVSTEEDLTRLLGQPAARAEGVDFLRLEDRTRLTYRLREPRETHPRRTAEVTAWLDEDGTVDLLTVLYQMRYDQLEYNRLQAVTAALGEPAIVLPSPHRETGNWEIHVYPEAGVWFEGSRTYGTILLRAHFEPMSRQAFLDGLYRR